MQIYYINIPNLIKLGVSSYFTGSLWTFHNIIKVINSLWLHMTSWYTCMVNIISGNGLLPDGIKPLPKHMLTYQWGSVAFTWGPFHNKYSRYGSINLVWKTKSFKIIVTYPRCKWVKWPLLDWNRTIATNTSSNLDPVLVCSRWG